MLDNATAWVVLLVALLAIGLIGTLVARRRAVANARYGRHARPGRRRRPHRDQFRPEDAVVVAVPKKRAAVIINPTKCSDIDAMTRRLTIVCERADWATPLVLLTTEQDHGAGVASEALDVGVEVVCVLGGDGTVRAVAASLVGTPTPLGLLPGGTGNLLARNLGMQLGTVEGAMQVAITGQNKRIDVGRLTVDVSGEDENPSEDIFLVMAGLGFDADLVAGANDQLKSTVGWPAYLVSGMKNLRGARFKVRVQGEDVPELTRTTRSVIIGNCGRLQGGIVLLPDAVIDDGRLDLVVLSPKGIVGWAGIAANVLSKHRLGQGKVDRHFSSEFTVRADDPVELQIDGDTVGRARVLRAVVDPLALAVRVSDTPVDQGTVTA